MEVWRRRRRKRRREGRDKKVGLVGRKGEAGRRGKMMVREGGREEGKGGTGGPTLLRHLPTCPAS